MRRRSPKLPGAPAGNTIADKTETLRSVYEEIDQLEKTEVEVKKYQRYRELFPLVALPGLVVLLLEVILNHTVWRKLP